MERVSSLVALALSVVLSACASSRVVAPAPAPTPQPVSVAISDATLAAASASLVENSQQYGEVAATFLYDDRGGPFGLGLRSRTLLDTRIDACRMTLSQTEKSWRIDEREPPSAHARQMVVELKDVDLRSIQAVKLGGRARIGEQTVNSKYNGSALEIRFKSRGGAPLFKFADQSEPATSQASFILNDSEVGAQAAKALMRVVELCQPGTTRTARAN